MQVYKPPFELPETDADFTVYSGIDADVEWFNRARLINGVVHLELAIRVIQDYGAAKSVHTLDEKYWPSRNIRPFVAYHGGSPNYFDKLMISGPGAIAGQITALGFDTIGEWYYATIVYPVG